MKTNLFKTTLLTITAIALVSFDLPSGWHIAGTEPKSYEMGIDKGAGQDGKNAATIKSIDKKIKGFGTLMQNSLPDKYLGKRVRISGYLKTKDVSDWSGLWLRIDRKDGGRLGFDNMHDGKKERSIKGTSDWTKCEIVIDVPNTASNISFGALLVGTGQLWFDNITFEVVDNTVETTGLGPEKTEEIKSVENKEPENLDFEK